MLSITKNFRAALNMLRSLYWSLKPIDLIAYCHTFDELMPLALNINQNQEMINGFALISSESSNCWHDADPII